MYCIAKTFLFCYGHRLLGDEGKCGRLHGHSARATITLEGEGLDERGMVFHFDRMKETIGRWIVENLDHSLLLAEGDPAAAALAAAGEEMRPLPFNPTAENIARMIFDAAAAFNLPIREVEVWESETSRATYRTSRGP